MTEQKNSSEKTEKTDRNEKPGSAPKKPSIEPKSARGASTTARRKTAEEADAALQDKIEKARAGAMPERREPAAAGESAGLPPVQTVRAMPQINRKKDETTSDEKAVAKKPSAPVKMPERDATGRFLPSEEKAKKPRANLFALPPLTISFFHRKGVELSTPADYMRHTIRQVFDAWYATKPRHLVRRIERRESAQ